MSVSPMYVCVCVCVCKIVCCGEKNMGMTCGIGLCVEVVGGKRVGVKTFFLFYYQTQRQL